MGWLTIPKVIKSVAPKLTKGESSAVKLHKLRMSLKKGSDTAEEAIRTGVKKFQNGKTKPLQQELKQLQLILKPWPRKQPLQWED